MKRYQNEEQNYGILPYYKEGGFTDIANILSDIITFFQGNVPAAIAALIIVLFLAYKKPKLFFTLFFLVILLVGIVYIITFVSDIGTSHKKTMIQRRTAP